MSKHELLALAVADLHLSSRPPPFRSAEPDWMETQAGYLKQVRGLSKVGKRGSLSERDVPCLIGGDLFDKWNAPHEAVCLALKYLPEKTFAIPGNHDLPNHQYNEMTRSAYGVLVESGRITNVNPSQPIILEDGPVPIRIWGFPCGFDVQPLKDRVDFYLEIALIHSYIWTTPSTAYQGAPETQSLRSCKRKVEKYSIAIFGDNHCGFLAEADDCVVLNCGGFSIRKSDERNYKPSVGLIYSDGSVERHFLDTSQDKYLDTDDSLVKILEQTDTSEFIEELMSLGDKALDFASCLHRLVESGGVSERVKKVILAALAKGDKA